MKNSYISHVYLNCKLVFILWHCFNLCITVKLTGLLLHLVKSDGDTFASRLLFKISSSAKLILKREKKDKHYEEKVRQIPWNTKLQSSEKVHRQIRNCDKITIILTEVPLCQRYISPRILFNTPVFNYHGQIRMIYNLYYQIYICSSML